MIYDFKCLMLTKRLLTVHEAFTNGLLTVCKVCLVKHSQSNACEMFMKNEALLNRAAYKE